MILGVLCWESLEVSASVLEWAADALMMLDLGRWVQLLKGDWVMLMMLALGCWD